MPDRRCHGCNALCAKFKLVFSVIHVRDHVLNELAD